MQSNLNNLLNESDKFFEACSESEISISLMTTNVKTHSEVPNGFNK